MAKKKKPESRFYRQALTIPPDLKRRMDEASEHVNWSAVAAKAFEDKLAEIASRKEQKEMSDVIQRLRASKMKSDSDECRSGHEDGRKWAMEAAEAKELALLEGFLNNLRLEGERIYEDFFVDDDRSFDTAATASYAKFAFDRDTDRDAAAEFWEAVVGTSHPSPKVVKGFCEGAVEVWHEVKDQI